MDFEQLFFLGLVFILNCFPSCYRGVLNIVCLLREKKTYVKNDESVTETQRLFKRRFNIGRHGNVPSRNSILTWVNALRTTGSLLKAKPPGPVRTARTLENVDRVREAITRSPRRSARRHSTELGISQSTMQRILHKDLVFQPYKIMTVQQ